MFSCHSTYMIVGLAAMTAAVNLSSLILSSTACWSATSRLLPLDMMMNLAPTSNQEERGGKVTLREYPFESECQKVKRRVLRLNLHGCRGGLGCGSWQGGGLITQHSAISAPGWAHVPSGFHKSDSRKLNNMYQGLLDPSYIEDILE